ncbi:hypothetical protein FSP39_000353 [Pinctada imbricata]|uniref:Uncharacterized protein n=1 Tax=Pinctada imbricata TaxID=66713 RepID=A0AA88XXG5_PINIB|nr:hypothetical protein FSP39_000353 [Pinctada imbricata]
MPLSQGSILDSTGKALEHRNIDKLDGKELEKYIAGAPLDLSGFAGKNVSREADSPLDLSTKTRKNHADSTENRDMYPFHPGGYTAIREMQTMMPPNLASNSTYVGGSTMPEGQSTMTMEAMYRRRQVSPQIPESVHSISKMYKQTQQLGPPPAATATARQWPEQERRMMPPRPDSVRNTTAAGYMHSRNKLAASSDEQYYAMIKSIQQRQANDSRYIKPPVSMNVMPGHVSSGHTSNSGMAVRQKQEHMGTVIAQKQMLARSALQGTTDGTRRIYHTTHKPNYLEIPQRCSPDSTISAGHMLSTEHKGRLMQSQSHPYSNSPVVGLTQGNVYPSVQATVPQIPREYQKASYHNRPVPYQRSRERSIKAETLTSEMLYMKQQNRPMLPQSASFPLQSTKTLHETQMQRSLIRGTSGITPSQAKEVVESKKRLSMTSSEHANLERSRQFLAGHRGKETVIKSPIPHMISTKHSQSSIRHNDPRNLVSSTHASSIPTPPNGSSTPTQKNAQTSFSPIASCESFSAPSQPKSQSTSTVPAPKEIYPLAISIPLTSESAKTTDVTKDSKESRPRPFSKKHIIMSAINRDEGLKNILNSDTPKTNFSPSANTKISLLPHDSSPCCPESPKMPTLSPQQKLPLQNAGPSQQGSDPPTLDIASKQDSFVKIPAKKAYFQDKRPRLLSSLPRKNEPDSEDEDADDDLDKDQDTINHENSIVFPKRQAVHYKKIPIANVAPMVHGSVSSEKDVREDTTSSETPETSIIKTDSYVEGAKSPILDTLAPVDTVITVKTATLVERRNSSLFPPQKSIFTVEKTVKDNIAKIGSVDCNLDASSGPPPVSTEPSTEPATDVQRTDDHVTSEPRENSGSEQIQREPLQENNSLDHVGCDDLDPNVDLNYGDSFDQQTLVPSVEVKKLVVCKDTGETILHRAARLGHLDVVVYCLTTGSVHVSAKDNAGYTPLHESCVSGHIDIVRLLLTNGASVNCASQDGIRWVSVCVNIDISDRQMQNRITI